MKIKNWYIGIILSCCISCTQKEKASKKVTIEAIKKENSFIGSPIVSLASITESFGGFWSYFNQYAELHQDFNSLDEAGKPMNKLDFLTKITTGKYLPLVLYSKEGAMRDFKLAEIPAQASKDIGAILRQTAIQEIKFFKMEGKPIPAFNFTAINRTNYTSENTKGKIVLFKCWFIGCTACVKEMPALNYMVAQLKNRKDILFISLAIDPKKNLQQFLTTTKFDYATVPDQESYMTNQLHVGAYPTHFIIDKKGNMVKAVNEADEMKKYLEKLL